MRIRFPGSAFRGLLIACMIGSGGAAQAVTPAPSNTPTLTPHSVGDIPSTGADCNGVKSVKYATPPASLNLVTATAKQLAVYGFPARPAGADDSPGVIGWKQAMLHAKVNESGSPACIGGTPFTTVQSTNYAGYEAPHSGVSFAESTWTVPSVAAHNYSGCGGGTMPPDAAVWVGMGTSSIIQTGTVSCSDTTATYRFWTEDYPQAPRYEGPTVHGGDTAYASVQWNGSSSCTYFEEDETTGGYASHTHNDCTSRGDDSADYILEQNTPYGIPTFATIRDRNNGFSTSGSYYNLTSSNGTKYVLYACDGSGNILVSPGSISSTDAGFNIVHYADNPTCS